MAGKKAKIKRECSGTAMCVLALSCAAALVAGWLLDRAPLGPDSDDVAVTAVDSALRINEVMTVSTSALKGGPGDWVEIANVGGVTVNLCGYTLRESGDVLAAFNFPAQELAPGEFLLIYCDGLDCAAAGHELHAAFRLSSDGESLELLDASGARADSVDVPALARNEVYRRTDAGAWEISGDYTPGLANTRENHLAFAHERVDGVLEISEIMAANASYAPDAQGCLHDYVEIHNATDAAFDLSGCCLTDDEDDLCKWSFPEGTTLAAGGYLLVYASGLDKTDGGELHASFRLSSDGEPVILSDAAGRTLGSVEYAALGADQACSLENGAYTYDLAPTPGRANTAENAAALHAEFLAKNNADGVYINEIMASSGNTAYDWMEIVNTSARAVDISGWGVSDDASCPRRWQFPGGTVLEPGKCFAFFLTGFDGRNAAGALCAAFRLSADGGYGVTLSDAGGKLLDRVFLPEQYKGIAYVRMADGRFLYTEKDTPNAENATSGYEGRVAKPTLSVTGGVFGAGETLTVEISAAPGATVYYTLDCSDPDQSAARYAGPITVSATAVVRARAYADNWLPSYMESQTYLFGVEHTMRVVSLVSDPDNLQGETGIYTNYGRDWEREGHVEIYTADGNRLLSENCGLKLHGADSRKLPQKNFKVIACGEYGADRFRARLFTERDYEEYQSFILRSSSEDGSRTRMRDSVLTSLAEGTGVFYQKTELCVVYINGVYWGHYNMRERICTASICQYEGWEGQENRIDLVKGNSTVMQGSDASYQEMLAWVRKNGVPTDEALKKVGEVIDLDNYIAYHALQIFVGNADTLNVKRYRNGDADGRWRWVIYDLDWGFSVDTDSIRRWLEEGGMGAGKCTDNSLFIALMKNAVFYDRFLTFIGERLADDWTTENVLAKIETRYNELLPELPAQFERWNQTGEKFRREMNKLVDYARTRPRRLIGYFHESLKLSDADLEKYFGDAIRRIEGEDAA